MVARHDLLNVVQREMALSQVVLQPMLGLRVLPAARAARKLGRLSLVQQQTLLNAMSGFERPVDVILVDASMAHPNGISPFGLVSQEAVVVLSGSSASITEAYSLIKKISHAFSRKHFRILVNKVRSQSDARSIFENISQVAAQRGVARLDYAGAIPLDDALRQAAQQCRPVLVQSPDSPAATAFRDIASDMLYWQRSECEAAGVGQFMRQLLHLSQRITPHAFRA
jgi:flagellar biosynthesis protein FlhG